MLADYEVLRGSTGRDILGEGPSWWVSESRLISIDGFGHKVRTSQLDGTLQRDYDAPSDIGFAVPTNHADTLVVGLRDGLFTLDLVTGAYKRLTAAGFDPTTHRINDGKVDRLGRLWYGTMHLLETQDSGELFVYTDSTETRKLGGIVVSNGIGWSPDNQVMYYADSGAGTITTFDYDLMSGSIENPRLFASDVGCFPDGLTVDAEGCVWSAKWDGGRVVRYDPSGAIMATFELPVSRPTSCMFAGEDLTTLVVTSAKPSTERPAEPLAGSIFLLDAGARGLPETPFAID